MSKFEEDKNMKYTLAVIVVTFFVFAAGSTHTTYAAPPTNACSLLTTAEVGTVLGSSVGSGQPLPGDSKVCRWETPLGNPKKTAFLVLLNPQAFAYAKMPGGQSITKVPVSGIGDDALYSGSRGSPTILTVKKGDLVFNIHVTGFADDQIKAKEKILALNILAKH